MFCNGVLQIFGMIFLKSQEIVVVLFFAFSGILRQSPPQRFSVKFFEANFGAKSFLSKQNIGGIPIPGPLTVESEGL